MPKFAIIIPIYNTERYVKATIDSLLMQPFDDFVIYAVDDASTDTSPKILDQIVHFDPRVKVFHLKQNVGVCGARNFALNEIEKANCFTHVLFIDSDDLVEPKLFEKLSAVINRDPEAEYITYGFKFLTCKGLVGKEFPRDLIPLKSRNEIVQQVVHSSFWKNKCYPNWSLCNKVFSTKLLVGLRFRNDMKIGEDIEFLCRIIQRARQGYFLGDALYLYRIRNSSATHSRQKNYSEDIEALLHLRQSPLYFAADIQILINTVIYRNIFSLYLRTVFYGMSEERLVFRKKYIPIAWSMFKKSQIKTKIEWLKYSICVFLNPCILSVLFSVFQKLRTIHRGQGFS